MSESYEVTVASKRDLSVIRRWLNAEFQRDHVGFYHNFVSTTCGPVWVCKQVGIPSVLGFLSGHLSTTPYMNIMQVREKFKRKGIGRQLVSFFLHQAEQYDPLGIEIQCQPRSSIPFWKRMGFVEVQRLYQDTGMFHYRAWCFKTFSTLPDGAEKTEVRVKLSNFKGVPSATEFETVAAKLNGEWHLQQHFVAHVSDADAYVEVFLSGRSVFKDKVKRFTPIGGERSSPFARLRVIKPPQQPSAISH